MTSHEKRKNNHTIMIIVIVVIIIIVIVGIGLGIYFVHKKKKPSKSPDNDDNGGKSNGGGGNNNNNTVQCGTWNSISPSALFTIQNGSDCLALTPNGSFIMSPTCSPQTMTGVNFNSWIYTNNSFASVIGNFYVGTTRGFNYINSISQCDITRNTTRCYS